METTFKAARKATKTLMQNTIMGALFQTLLESAFKAGVDFTQQYIPVEKELPKKSNGMYEGRLLLVKTKFDVVYAG